MKTSTVLKILFFVCFFPTTLAFGQETAPVVDQNAALRYLMALSWFNPPPEKIRNEMFPVEHLDDLKKLSPEALDYLKSDKYVDHFKNGKSGNLFNVIELMKDGAKCSTCVFNPDKKFLPNDFIPPLWRLREMARVARIIGGLKAFEGKHQEALDIFKAVYRLGQHLDQEGVLISALVGIACRKLALHAMSDLCMMNPDSSVVEDMKVFLRAIPKPPVDFPKMYRGEKAFFENGCRFAQKNPEYFAAKFRLVSTASGTTMVLREELDVSGKSMSPCAVNQWVLRGALKMLQMHFEKPLPAVISAHLKESLLEMKYLKSFPECPEKGEYLVEINACGVPCVQCSVHKSIGNDEDAANATETQSLAPAEIEAWRMFLNGPAFEAYFSETSKLYDSIIQIDPKVPGFVDKLREIQKVTEVSTNPFILNFELRLLCKSWEQQKPLEDEIEKLLK